MIYETKEKALAETKLIDEHNYHDWQPNAAHPLKGVWSKSALHYAAHNPHKWAAGHRKTYKSVMFMGSLVDMLMTEPMKFHDTYHVTAEEDGRTAAYKAAKKAAEESGKVLVKEAEVQTAQAMCDALMNHPEGIAMIKGDPQAVFTAAARITHPAAGDDKHRECFIPFKIKTDYCLTHEDGSVDVWDIKVTGVESDEEIARICRNLGYHWQEELYTRVITAGGSFVRSFKFVFVCEEPPHRIRIVEFNDEALAGAASGIQKGLSIVKAVADGHLVSEIETPKLILGSKIEKPHYWDTVMPIPDHLKINVDWT